MQAESVLRSLSLSGTMFMDLHRVTIFRSLTRQDAIIVLIREALERFGKTKVLPEMKERHDGRHLIPQSILFPRRMDEELRIIASQHKMSKNEVIRRLLSDSIELWHDQNWKVSR